MIRLNLVSVGMIEDTGNVVLVLRPPELPRLLIMQVGLLEGRAVALEAEGIRAPRPLTHEVTLKVIESLGARIVQVDIHDFRGDIFFSNIILEDSNGKQQAIDSRPSDAIALAMRVEAPIYASREVMSIAGVDENQTEDVDQEEDGEPVVH